MKQTKEFYNKITNSVYFRISMFGIVFLIVVYFFLTRNIPNPDIITLTFAILALGFKKGKSFLRDWWPILLYFFAYEFIRGHASYFHDAFNIATHETTLLVWEQTLFGENIPILWLQPLQTNGATVLDVFAVLMYLSFFFVLLLIGFMIWLKDTNLFQRYKYSFIILCFGALVTYLLFPAFPPWMAAEHGYLPPLIRNTWTDLNIGQWVTVAFHSVGYNAVAPMPSLHMGWAYMGALFWDKLYSKANFLLRKSLFLYPVCMAFVVVYTADHYVVDLIAGVLYAQIAFWLAHKYSTLHNF